MISHRILRTIIRHLNAVISLLERESPNHWTCCEVLTIFKRMISLSSSGQSFSHYSLGPLWTSLMRRVLCPNKCMQTCVWLDFLLQRNTVLPVVSSFRWSISQLLSAAVATDGVRPTFLQKMILNYCSAMFNYHIHSFYIMGTNMYRM